MQIWMHSVFPWGEQSVCACASSEKKEFVKNLDFQGLGDMYGMLEWITEVKLTHNYLISYLYERYTEKRQKIKMVQFRDSYLKVIWKWAQLVRPVFFDLH